MRSQKIGGARFVTLLRSGYLIFYKVLPQTRARFASCTFAMVAAARSSHADAASERFARLVGADEAGIVSIDSAPGSA